MMHDCHDSDEFHQCPACGLRTRHRVSRDRKLAPVLWCQRCFHVHIQAEPQAASQPVRVPVAARRRDVA